ncbi:uncharacterized protein [Porites lutea]|uniref:uncharacterized protein n=1 Tax=Porites lutea TaxID=51062 RepID=UPI003CC5624A
MGKVKPTKRKSRKGKKKETAEVPIEKTEAKRLMLREIREEGYDGEFFADNLETKMADRMKRGKLPRRIRYLEYCHWAHSLMRKEIGPSDAQFSFSSTVLSFIRALIPGEVVGKIREVRIHKKQFSFNCSI